MVKSKPSTAAFFPNFFVKFLMNIAFPSRFYCFKVQSTSSTVPSATFLHSKSTVPVPTTCFPNASNQKSLVKMNQGFLGVPSPIGNT